MGPNKWRIMLICCRSDKEREWWVSVRSNKLDILQTWRHISTGRHYLTTQKVFFLLKGTRKSLLKLKETWEPCSWKWSSHALAGSSSDCYWYEHFLSTEGGQEGKTANFQVSAVQAQNVNRFQQNKLSYSVCFKILMFPSPVSFLFIHVSFTY